MPYALGSRLLKRLCEEQKPLLWQKAKLSPPLFKAYEQPVFEYVQTYLKTHHTLPKVETLVTTFPDVAQMETPEPVSYYLQQVENQYFYDRLNKANLDSQAVLKADQDAHLQALEVLKQCTRDITEHKYRLRILDVAKEAPILLLEAYHQTQEQEAVAAFGWPYLDYQSGGLLPGEVISIVGRPALGKTWAGLWTALHNWRHKKVNVLFVSMEMMTLPIAQRIGALYTKQNIQQLKMSGFSDQTLKKFYAGLKAMSLEEAKFYVVDGNLAANAEDVFMLADMLACKLVFIDGAYLLRHRNTRLDRFTRAAENVELIKRFCTDQDMTAFCSWQFNRVASQKQKKGKGEQGDLEDIGYSDTIGQISSIVLGFFQEDGIETMKERRIRILKGRNGEIGQFSIAWDFIQMSFAQTNPSVHVTPEQSEPEHEELQWL